MTGSENDGTTPMTMTMPPADTTPPPSAPSFSDINGLNSAQRLPAITTNPANTENDSITQSTNADDSISATDSDGNLMFHVVNGERVAVMVDNSNADWTGTNAPPLSTFSYIFDKDTGDRKTDLAEYKNGDFYAVTGFWYRSPTDFGVFADGSPRTVDLPTTGNARYKGNIGGQYWGDIATRTDDTGAPNISGSFVGNINLQVVIPSVGSNNTVLRGQIDILATDDLQDINFEWDGIMDNNGNGVFTGANQNQIACIDGCDDDPASSNLSARLVGDPVSIPGGENSGGFPAGIIGAFGIQDLPIGNTEVDMLGFFGAIHVDLCATTGTGDAAFCTK